MFSKIARIYLVPFLPANEQKFCFRSPGGLGTVSGAPPVWGVLEMVPMVVVGRGGVVMSKLPPPPSLNSLNQRQTWRINYWLWPLAFARRPPPHPPVTVPASHDSSSDVTQNQCTWITIILSIQETHRLSSATILQSSFIWLCFNIF